MSVETLRSGVVTLASSAEPRRLDRAVACAFPTLIASRAAAKRACKQGRVLVNGAPAEPSRWVHPGDRLQLVASQSARAAVFGLSLRVLFEDPWMAVVYKPPGYPVSGNRHRTIAHALPFNLAPSDRPDALPAPWPAHRLDAATSGLLVVGKTGHALAALNEAFATGQVRKTYRALVRGRLEGPVTVDRPLDLKAARTHVVPLDTCRSVRCGWITAVDASPAQGRTHQLRRHLSALGHPILGDALYTASGPLLKGSGLYLSATHVALRHPRGDLPEVALEVGQPHKFTALWRRTREAWAAKHRQHP